MSNHLDFTHIVNHNEDVIDQYFKLLIITWIASQSLKFFITSFRRKKFSVKAIPHTYLFASGMPSTHSSILFASFLFLHRQLGNGSPLLFIFTVFSIFWLYEIYLQRRRFRILMELTDTKETHEKHILLKELNGHDFRDIVLGIAVGAVVYKLFVTFG